MLRYRPMQTTGRGFDLIACIRQLIIALRLVMLACSCTAFSCHPYSDGSGCTKWTAQVARRLMSVAPWSVAWII